MNMGAEESAGVRSRARTNAGWPAEPKPQPLQRLLKETAWLLAVAGFIVGLFAASHWLSLSPAHSGDPRDYDRSGGDVWRGDGSLETVLAHYEIALPCHATDVHFHDFESIVGSEGILLLRFDTSRTCFGSFARGADLSLKEGTSDDWQADGTFNSIDFVGDDARGYGWSFPTSHTLLWGTYTASDAVSVRVVVDRHASSDTVYLVGNYG
ncbi:hypothetical protein ACLQ18_31540 [Streptomyces sp. DT193]|uniref:hypothetical protein n=1 Tax=Streptomyces sp. DT193 TaxID=3393418 RepID=UPI003CF5F683